MAAQLSEETDENFSTVDTGKAWHVTANSACYLKTCSIVDSWSIKALYQ